MLTQMTAMGLTLVIEAPLVALAGRYMQRPVRRMLVAALLPSLLTHPFAWHAWTLLGPHDFVAGVLLIEALVWGAEAVMLRFLMPMKWRQAILLSLVANSASVTAGWLLF